MVMAKVGSTLKVGLQVLKLQVDSTKKRTSDLESPLKVRPKYKILGQKELCNCFYGHLKIGVFGKKTLPFSI